MDAIDLDKLRSIGSLRSGYKKATKTIRTDDKGSNIVKHWSGRQDAHIVATPIVVKAFPKEGM